MVEKLKGKLTISRVQSNVRDDVITIRVEDDSSLVKFVEVEVSPDVFALCLTGLGCGDCDFELRGTHLVGKKHEYKRELLPRPEYRATDEEIAAIAKPFEVDGWKASLDDITNAHNWRIGDKVCVGFHRHV